MVRLSDVKAVEAAVKLRNEGDQAEALFLLEMLGSPLLRDVVLALARHLPEDRRHGASEVAPPFAGKVRVGGE